jgi:Protein of unknown function (DUF3017)
VAEPGGERVHRDDLHEAPFGLVLLIELVGVCSVFLAPQHWLRAVGVLAAGVLVAGLLRLVLSDEQAGLLRVRRRSFDVACYWLLGVFTIVVALGLPQR